MISVNLKTEPKQQLKFRKTNPIYDKSHTTLHEKKTLQSAGKINDLGTLEKENSDPLLKSEGHLQNESIVEGIESAACKSKAGS